MGVDGSVVPLFPGTEPKQRAAPVDFDSSVLEQWSGATVTLTASGPSVIYALGSRPDDLREMARVLVDLADGIEAGDNPLEVARAEWVRRRGPVGVG